MYLRFLSIAFLHWLVSFFVTALFLGLLLPRGSSGWMLNVPAWALAFLFSVLFASWAFSPYLPGRREEYIAATMWLITLFTGTLAYGTFFTLNGPSIVLGREFLIQLLVQLIGVWLAGYRLRRRKLKELLGEGMVM